MHATSVTTRAVLTCLLSPALRRARARLIGSGSYAAMREAINGYYVKLVRKCHYWGDSWRAATGLNISSAAQRSSARDNLSLSRANAPPFCQGLISPRESARVLQACDFSERDRAQRVPLSSNDSEIMEKAIMHASLREAATFRSHKAIPYLAAVLNPIRASFWHLSLRSESG